ncbi:hypothetical protein ABZ719_10770 [Streptomyces sp. NPDC006743]|uniref:hypothetical protein n=1 Tax=Streptomyces sp. NPDC006743 TaxID=3154480 RepID=UPI003451A9B6
MDASEEDYFAFFSLTGDRFDAPGMPADTAREVGNFREAVLKVARDLWLESNPDRRRLPNGFNEAFDLRLIAVTSGSARPRMVLHRPSGKISDQDWDEWSGIYSRARDVLTESLQEIARTRQTPINFSADSMRAIRRVGSSLQDSEAIILGDPKQDSRRATVDLAVREILEEIEELVPTPQRVQLEGIIVEYDGSTMSFRLRTASGVSTCRLDQTRHDLAVAAKEFLAADGVTAPDVQVEGETSDPTQKSIQLFNVTGITAVRSWEEKTLLLQLQKIRELTDTWLGPDSQAPSDEVASKVEHLIPRLATLGVDVAIVPNSEGAIVLEWRRGDVEMSAAVESDDQLFLCADNTVTDELQEKQVEFNEAALVRFLESGSMN